MFRTEERTVKFNFKCTYKHLSKNKYQNKLNQSAGIERSLFKKGDTSMNSLFYWPLKLKSIQVETSAKRLSYNKTRSQNDKHKPLSYLKRT